MSPTLVALVGFAIWSALLVFSLAGLRMITAQRLNKDLNSFLPDGSDLEGLGQRWTRAHLNCLEFLPIAGVVGLAAVVSGQAAVTDGLAMLLLYFRIGQSVVHLISTSVAFVMIRATLFVGQILIVLYWSYGLLTA
ncbi:MAG: MAPEG family protein [Deltaproteobacteria bacterium]|nr:MAPEG family protein [Deltaproteobacteria bacterium]MBW2396508.1 MAPEG family protein [Deltaproteobacteria bacterium]